MLNYRDCLIGCCFLGTLILMLNSLPSRAQVDQELFQRFKYVLFIDEHVAGECSDPKLRIKPVIKISVNLAYNDNRTRQLVTTKYEDFWFANSQTSTNAFPHEVCVGCRRFAQLNLVPKSATAIVVNQSGKSEAEAQAIANSIVRLYLEAKLSDAGIGSVIVPDCCYAQIIDCLQEDHFTSAALMRGAVELYFLMYNASGNAMQDMAYMP